MKSIKLLTILLISGVTLFSSCSDDDDSCHNPEVSTNAKTISIETLANGGQSAPDKQTGEFVKFSFKEGKIVTGDHWDFAVRGRVFIINGKKDKNQALVYNDPERKGNVEVTSLLGEFSKIKDVGGFVKTDWHQDYEYASGFYDPIALAISFDSNSRNSSNSRQAWHLRSGKDGGREIVLAPVVFVFKTVDGHVAKMEIKKMDRTNANFDEKEEIKYTIRYYYNPKETSVLLDETK